eukprot:1161645-Pelagomonas_calceolata.AAC.5
MKARIDACPRFWCAHSSNQRHFFSEGKARQKAFQGHFGAASAALNQIGHPILNRSALPSISFALNDISRAKVPSGYKLYELDVGTLMA